MTEIEKMNEKIEKVLAKEEKGRRSTFTKHKLSEELSKVNFL